MSLPYIIEGEVNPLPPKFMFGLIIAGIIDQRGNELRGFNPKLALDG